MTEEQLIAKLKELKSVTPNKQWVFSVKMSILKGEESAVAPTAASRFAALMAFLYKGKLAYVYAAFALVALGLFGFMGYSNLQMANKSVAVLSPDFVVKSRVEALKLKSQDLASALISKQPETISVAVKEVKDATKELTETIAQNPAEVKSIAADINNNKTYLDILGTSDLKATSDDLYKTIDEQMIADLDKTTLTDSQKTTLQDIKDLYNEGKYSQALEKILAISN